jgi:hypothetical protein
MSEKISIKECKKLLPEQWVKVYGVISNCCKYINTCQTYQLQTVVRNIPHGWFDDIVLHLVDEEERPIAIEEVRQR